MYLFYKIVWPLPTLSILQKEDKKVVRSEYPASWRAGAKDERLYHIPLLLVRKDVKSSLMSRL